MLFLQFLQLYNFVSNYSVFMTLPTFSHLRPLTFKDRNASKGPLRTLVLEEGGLHHSEGRYREATLFSREEENPHNTGKGGRHYNIMSSVSHSRSRHGDQTKPLKAGKFFNQVKLHSQPYQGRKGDKNNNKKTRKNSKEEMRK